MKRSTQWLGAVSSVSLIAMSSAPAMAQGTTAGDTITNNVSVSFQVGGVDQTDVTASDSITVDRRIDVDVNFTGATPVSISPGQQNAVLAFDVTNLSNDVIDLDLTATLTGGTGAAGDLSTFEIYLDADGDGVLDAAELAAGPITFLDEVTADPGDFSETISVLVVTDIDLAAANGDTFDVALVANAHEGGTASSLGTEIVGLTDADANTAGEDTVLADGDGGTGEEAANDGAHSDQGTLSVAGAQVTVIKSSRIVSDPVNGVTNPKAIPGAVIEYCIAVSNAASSATATSVNVSDDLPADVTFTENGFGIFVDGSAVIDDNGTVGDTSDDSATCSGGSDGEGTTATFTAAGGTGGLDLIAGSLSDIGGGVTRSLYFRVTID